jgi:hypothetical protein
MRDMTVKTRMNSGVNTNAEKETLLREEWKKLEELRNEFTAWLNYDEEIETKLKGFIYHETKLEEIAKKYGFIYIGDQDSLAKYLGVDVDHAYHFLYELFKPKNKHGITEYYRGILYSPKTSMFYLVSEVPYRALNFTNVYITTMTPSKLKDLVERAPWVSLP